MNYVYDILVNFKYPFLEFYEWDTTDNIENIKRIPLYKISTSDLNLFKYHKFKIKDIESIKGNTKIFNDKKKVYNSCIYTDGNEAIVFNFDSNGVCIAKSDLLFDEEEEILGSSSMLEEVFIEYKILSKDKLDLYKTRREVNITKFLIDEINKIDNIDMLNYVYYECFDDHSKVSKTKLINTIKKSFDEKYYRIYDFFKSISMNKN